MWHIHPTEQWIDEAIKFMNERQLMLVQVHSLLGASARPGDAARSHSHRCHSLARPLLPSLWPAVAVGGDAPAPPSHPRPTGLSSCVHDFAGYHRLTADSEQPVVTRLATDTCGVLRVTALHDSCSNRRFPLHFRTDCQPARCLLYCS